MHSDIFEKIYIKFRKNRIAPMREMVRVFKKDTDSNLPNGFLIEMITPEFKGTGEEPHFHLFPANHIDRRSKQNNYDLVSRVHITKNLPSQLEDIHAINNKKNPLLPKNYQLALFNLFKNNSKLWEKLQDLWDLQANANEFGRNPYFSNQ
jgi:hypothetical protein